MAYVVGFELTTGSRSPVKPRTLQSRRSAQISDWNGYLCRSCTISSTNSSRSRLTSGASAGFSTATSATLIRTRYGRHKHQVASAPRMPGGPVCTYVIAAFRANLASLLHNPAFAAQAVNLPAPATVHTAGLPAHAPRYARMDKEHLLGCAIPDPRDPADVCGRRHRHLDSAPQDGVLCTSVLAMRQVTAPQHASMVWVCGTDILAARGCVDFVGSGEGQVNAGGGAAGSQFLMSSSLRTT
jgi:hypothetical protein